MPLPAQSFSARVLARLTASEAQEIDPWRRDDLRIARLTVAYAAHGAAVLCCPHVLASYTVLGLHPEKVWPAILARREALGPFCLEVSGAPPIPKKPAQSVKLWTEETNGARAINSRAAMKQGSPRTTSVPMAAPSIAALYRNSDAPSSAKQRQFSLDELKQLIHYSGAPVPTRALTIAALEARGPWPNEDGPATTILCISLKGMMLEGGVCKRTVQRRIKRACNLGFWRRTREANSWSNCPKCGSERDAAKCPNEKCEYKGSTKNKGEFTRPYTYEFDLGKFVSEKRCREIHSENWRSYSEYKQGGRATVAEMPARKPAQPSTPQAPLPPAPAAPPPPKREQPAAERSPNHEHRKTARITRDERLALFAAYIALKRSGMTHETAIAEVVRQFKGRYTADEIDWTIKVVSVKQGGMTSEERLETELGILHRGLDGKRDP